MAQVQQAPEVQHRVAMATARLAARGEMGQFGRYLRDDGRLVVIENFLADWSEGWIQDVEHETSVSFPFVRFIPEWHVDREMIAAARAEAENTKQLYRVFHRDILGQVAFIAAEWASGPEDAICMIIGRDENCEDNPHAYGGYFATLDGASFDDFEEAKGGAA